MPYGATATCRELRISAVQEKGVVIATVENNGQARGRVRREHFPSYRSARRKAGVHKKSEGEAQLYPADEHKIKAQVGRYRLEHQPRAVQQETGVFISN